MNKANVTPIEMLRRLIGFDTTSHKSNLALIEFVREYLDDYSVETRLIFDDTGTKANLWATAGPADVPGVVLSGHTDVVPVKGQPWSSDPFALTERDHRLHGRGTADMKAFIAIVLAELPGFLERRPRRPVHLALTYDEEVGCIGARSLLAAISKNRPRPQLVIVGEPTDLRLVNCHKGIHAFETRVTGRDAHSSMPHLGVSAITTAVRIIDFLNELAEEKRGGAHSSLPFNPPWTSLNVGIIEGGTALNIIPRECRVVWEYRPLPGEDPHEIRHRVQAYIDSELDRDGQGVPVTEIREIVCVPALAPAEPDSPAVRFARSILGDDHPAEGASFTTEGGLFQAAGVPAVVCGPGSLAQAHQADEFITLEQMKRGTRFVREVYARIAEGGAI